VVSLVLDMGCVNENWYVPIDTLCVGVVCVRKVPVFWFQYSGHSVPHSAGSVGLCGTEPVTAVLNGLGEVKALATLVAVPFVAGVRAEQRRHF